MTWLLDGRRFARKVKNATETIGSEEDINQNCKQSRCPTCGSALQNYWPGYPAGVKFDPSDKELIDHLAAKIGVNGSVAHPFLDEFIPTLDAEDGICYRHPEKLPGIKLDGSSSHFFHRPANAYTTGNRKRRKIHCENANRGETRWHKTGKTRPVIENGKQIGCKKIMVLYTNFGKNVKPNKTCWVMHQYHLGTAEDEKDGELVVSKVFFQTQPRQSRKDEECGNEVEESRLNIQDEASNLGAKGMPVTPQTSPPVRPVRTEQGHDELTGFKLANSFHNQGDQFQHPENVNIHSYGNAGQSLPDHGSSFSIQAHGSTENCIPDNRSTAIACGQPDLNSQYGSFNAGTTFLQPISTNCPAPLDSAAVNVGIQITEGARLECSTEIPAWAGESQLPDEQEAELHADFLCHETLICDPMANSSSAPMEDFRKFAADIGFLFDGVTDGEFAVDNIDVDTPPGFLQDIAALWPKSQSQSNQI